MAITIEATYENGVLKPVQPLPLKERQQVQVTIQSSASITDQTYGLVGWSGDAATFDSLLRESETNRMEQL